MKLLVYHGSDHIIEKPEYKKVKKYNDYGVGFYTTMDKELALEWAVDFKRDGYANAYDTDVMYIARAKLGAMIEIAVNIKKISIEKFIQIFLKSRLCSAFERGSNVWVLGKSSIELLEILLEEEINDYDICDYPTPE